MQGVRQLKMINLTKVQIYIKYAGDIDAWLKYAEVEEKSIFNEDEWGLIDSIVDYMKVLKASHNSSATSQESIERTYTPMTPQEHMAATNESNQFVSVINPNEYEVIINVLYQHA